MGKIDFELISSEIRNWYELTQTYRIWKFDFDFYKKSDDLEIANSKLNDRKLNLEKTDSSYLGSGHQYHEAKKIIKKYLYYGDDIKDLKKDLLNLDSFKIDICHLINRIILGVESGEFKKHSVSELMKFLLQILFTRILDTPDGKRAKDQIKIMIGTPDEEVA